MGRLPVALPPSPRAVLARAVRADPRRRRRTQKASDKNAKTRQIVPNRDKTHKKRPMTVSINLGPKRVGSGGADGALRRPLSGPSPSTLSPSGERAGVRGFWLLHPPSSPPTANCLYFSAFQYVSISAFGFMLLVLVLKSLWEEGRKTGQRHNRNILINTNAPPPFLVLRNETVIVLKFKRFGILVLKIRRFVPPPPAVHRQFFYVVFLRFTGGFLRKFPAG